MKRFLMFILTITMCCLLNSCSVTTYPTTQDDIYTEVSVDEVDIAGVDMAVVIRYGRPYYYSGSLLYYLYRGIYYYPYYYDNYWYFRAYRRPFPYTHARPYFRPHRYDYRFNRDFVGHRNWYRNEPITRGRSYNHDRTQPRPDMRPNNLRPDVRNTHPFVRPNNGRPNIQPNVRPQTQSRGGSTISRPSTPTRSGSVSRPSNMGGSRSGGFGGSSHGGGSMRGGRGR